MGEKGRDLFWEKGFERFTANKKENERGGGERERARERERERERDKETERRTDRQIQRQSEGGGGDA